MELVVIFRRYFILLGILCLAGSSNAQISADSIERLYADSNLWVDSVAIDTLFPKDTIVYNKFLGTNKDIYLKSRREQRNALSPLQNPPIRNGQNNYFIFLWGVIIAVLFMVFKLSYQTQYYLINKAWINNLSYREFYETQTEVFKTSKFFTWFIISQVFALGIFITIQCQFKHAINFPPIILAILISLACILIFSLNHAMKSLFSYTFKRNALSKDYAIIFRINAYNTCKLLLPILLILYYSNSESIHQSIQILLLIALLFIYMVSFLKFSFLGLFSESRTSIFLILYLCTFEILPLLVLVKSVFNNLV